MNQETEYRQELKKGAILESRKLPLSLLDTNKGQIPDVPKNPRFIRDERYKKLLQSIKDDPEFLSVNEIKVYPYKDRYVVIGGNMRFRALKEQGETEVVCKIIPAAATAKQLRAYIQKDNISYGEWDIDALVNEWSKDELEEWGLDIPGIDDVMAEEEAEEDNFDVDANTPDAPKTRYGDIYQLGAHRLVCGDSTKEATFDALFSEGVPADCLITDPPYNVDYTARGHEKIANDHMEEGRFLQFLTDSLSKAAAHLKLGGAFYIWHADSHGLTFRQAVGEAGLELKENLIWLKNSFVLGRQDYQWIHEPCLYGWRPGAAHYFTASRSLSTVIEEETPAIEKMTKDQMHDLLARLYDLPQSVLHPTMKPVKLMGRLILNSTRHGESVLDIFGGSGSTLVAAEQLGRRCLMVEYEPRYIDAIIGRWEELTGKQAALVGNFADPPKTE